jgi:hypothetical protein
MAPSSNAAMPILDGRVSGTTVRPRFTRKTPAAYSKCEIALTPPSSR